MFDTALCGCLLILILCRQSQSFCETVNKDLCIEEIPKTWREASQSCNLVVSNTPLRVSVPITDIPVPRHRSSAPTYMSQDLHWIGATGTFTPWFELAGCNLYLNFPFYKQWMPRSKLGPVAQCHQICKNWRNSYKEIGINETHCFCADYNNMGFVKKFTCYQHISKNFKNDLIGTGTDQRTGRGIYVFASYRKVRLTTEIDDRLDQCLLETNEGYKTYPCDSADITQRTWIQRYRNEIKKNNSLPRWTPYVRRLIISWKKDSNAVQNTSVCIAVINQNGSYEPLPRLCDETHTSICKNADSTTDRTTRHTTSSDLSSSMRHTTFVHNIASATPFNRHKDRDGYIIS